MKRTLLAAVSFLLPAAALGATDLVEGPPSAEQLEREIQVIGGELESLEAERIELEAKLKRSVRALHRLARRPALSEGEGFEAVFAHHGRLKRLERVVRAEIEGLHLAGERRRALEDSLVSKREALEAERTRLAAIEKRRTQLENRARVFSGELPSLGVVPIAPIAAPGGAIVVHGEDDSLSLGFSSMRGRLGAPVRGTFRVRDAVRDGGPGLEILVSEGAPVHAVADGRVAYSDLDPDHGRIVIVDHGQGYFTVYGGLSGVRASAGAFVAKGQAIGAADASGVYFEVRQGARSLDPRHWTGL